MIKNIFVPMSGTDGDAPILASAWTIGSAFQAHLEFLHIKMSTGAAAFYAPHTDFAQGPALVNAISALHAEADQRSLAARQEFDSFCKSKHIEITDAPRRRHGVTAHFGEEIDAATEVLATRARHSDLIVFGRPKYLNRLPEHLLEHLLLSAGRPFLIPSQKPIETVPGTVMVCWRETPDAARAAGAALPFLQKAGRVIVAAVGGHGRCGAAEEFASSLGWHGIAAEVQAIADPNRDVATILADLARKNVADLIVMGAYGRSRTRELIFGGCTRSVIETSDVPVLMLH